MDRIKKITQAITQKYGTNSPFELCDLLGVQVVYTELPLKVKGFCIRLLQNHVIVLNQDLTMQESRVVCAHELGHYLLHGNMNALEIEENTNLCLPRYEREADYFAACLLLQEECLQEQGPFDVMTVEHVATMSGVPEDLVRLRFSVDKSSYVS